jgi:hypothetical protein
MFLVVLLLLLSEGACVVTPLFTRRSWEERNQRGVTYLGTNEYIISLSPSISLS